jgi:ATP-binding cassette subfamily B multidrug efflux pump
MKHLRKLFRFIKPYWRRSTVALLLLTLLVFLDLSIPRLVQRIIDQGINGGSMTVVLHTSLLMLGISLLSAIFAVGNSILSIQVGEGVARDLRDALFLKIQDFSYGNYDEFTTGKLMVRLSSDTTAVQRLVQVSLRIGTRAPLLMIGSIVMMFSTDSRLALALSPLILITTVIIVLFILRMEPLFRIVQQKLDRLNTVLQENIAGVRVVKAFVRSDFENKRFGIANEDFTARTIRVMQFMSSMTPLLTLFVNLGMVVVIWAGGLQSIQGSLSVGQIIAFTNYLLTTMTPLTMMTPLSNTWASGFASAERVNEILDAVPEVQDSPTARPLPSSIAGQVKFNNVSFHYNGANQVIVLDGISFTAEPGQTVAILGATGAGKTSLTNLIPRFYDPTSGRITLDGMDLQEIQQDSLLSQIGVVPQETVLFSGTVRENIRYANPQASEEEVVDAAKAAQAHEFIIKMKQGYDSHIEERGVNLSGGQKQRLAIARALLMKPKILILDDSTSSVDVETENRIQSALHRPDHKSTTLVIAQRISTVLNADKIVVIDRGRVAAEGTHVELMKSSKIYQEIYDSQLGDGFHEE